MPVIHTHVSVPTTPEQREALKAALWQGDYRRAGQVRGLANVPVRGQYADLLRW